MSKLLGKDQRGFGHVGAILVIIVVLAVGGVGWWVWKKNDSSSTADKALQDAVKNAKCDYDDKDICKFFASWKETEHYTINSTTEFDGKTTTMVMQSEGKDKTYVKLSGDTPYETITIDNTLYTKAGDTWYKQTLETDKIDEYKGDVDVDFSEPTEGDATKVTYKKLGTEKCGELTCLKYEVVDPSTPDTTQYLWFDNKDYQLRKMEVSSSDGSKYTSTFSYEKVSIKEPSPVKELGANQYIVPGQSEPITLPSAGDTPSQEELDQLIQQYQ